MGHPADYQWLCRATTVARGLERPSEHQDPSSTDLRLWQRIFSRVDSPRIDDLQDSLLSTLPRAERIGSPTRGFRATLRGARKIADLLAEREGFEPSVPVAQYARLAIWCLRPLGHLSAGRKKGIFDHRSARRKPRAAPTPDRRGQLSGWTGGVVVEVGAAHVFFAILAGILYATFAGAPVLTNRSSTRLFSALAMRLSIANECPS